MSKEQQQKTARETLLSHVAALTKKIEAASEDELKAWAGKLDAESNLKAEADKAATEEKAIAEKSTGENTAAAADGQNARANANWPVRSATMAASLVELARRDAKTASVMLAKAKEIVADDDEEDDDCVACKAAAQNLVKMASARTKTASDMMQMARDIMGDEDEKKSMPPWLEKKIGDKEANTKIAAQLVALAKKVVADDEEPEEDESGKEVAAALVELAKTLSETKD